jgi:ABC-type uncharacterized transport system auxiliary subunit
MVKTTKTFLLLAAFGLLVWLAACDKIGEDAQPQLDKTKKYTAKTNEPVVINLLKKHGSYCQFTGSQRIYLQFTDYQYIKNTTFVDLTLPIF